MMKWKCAMTKYVSCRWMSAESVARTSPVSPPIVKRPTKPSAYSMGASKEIRALCSVAVQLKTLMAEGTATMKDISEKNTAEVSEMPAVNMWWPQTKKPMMAIEISA